MLSRSVFRPIFIAMAILTFGFGLMPKPSFAQTYAGKIGVEEGSRGNGEFVDLGKTLRQFTAVGGGANTPMDSNGWPTTDGETVLLDDRPLPAWAPPLDDPAGYQPDESGTYHCSFNGQATLGTGGGSIVTFANQTYVSATNTTTFDLTVPAGTWQTGPALIVIDFTNTKRTSGSATNTGITNLQCIRPGYGLPSGNPQMFTNPFLAAFAPFGHVRYMGWRNTNYAAGFYGDPGHHVINWANRELPTDATQGMTALRPGALGISWEYIILLANQINKDVWINIPISASGFNTTDTTSYIYQLALLFKNGNAFTGGHGLNPGLHIYIEHSNEVWNFSFSQYIWNKSEAVDAVAGTGPMGATHVNSDGSTDQEVWAHRRHAERLYQIGQIFATVFGAGSLNTTIRPVYASWTINPQSYYSDVLTWMNSQYGAPSGYFYAIAGTSYFNNTPTAGQSVASILASMQANSDANLTYTQQLRTVANTYGLKLYSYEGGPDNGGGDTTNVGNRILANRDPGINAVIQHDVRVNYFGLGGGDSYNYFTMSGGYSRYGCWGASDDITKVDPSQPKWAAIYNLTGYNYGGAPSAPTGFIATSGNTQVVLNWTASAGATSYNIYRGTTAGGENGTAIATGIATTSYTNTGLANGTTYYYKAAAVNASGTSAQSSEASATPGSGPTIPAAPTGLAATPGNAQVALSWAASSGATSYNVLRSTVNGSGYAGIATGLAATSYTNTGLTNGTTYYYVVTATNSAGTSGNSNQAGATPSAGGGTNLALNKTASADASQAGNPPSYGNDGGTTTKWCAPDPNTGHWWKVDLGQSYALTNTTIIWEQNNAYKYKIEVSADNISWSTAVDRTANTTAAQTMNDTFSATGRYVRLTVTGGLSGGVWACFGEFQVYGGRGSAPAPPPKPGAARSNGQVALSWTASTGATSYTVNFTTGGNYTVAGTPTGTSFTHTGLTNGTLYSYYVTAANANGTSGASNNASATPAASGGSNLALNKTATADASQAGNPPASGNDGSTTTKWCAPDPNTGHWWKVDLGQSYALTNTTIIWEQNNAYKYKIEVSADNISWSTAVDKTANTTAAQTMNDTFSATGRYVRLTITGGLSGGVWACFGEFQVYGGSGSVPAAPTNLAATPGNTQIALSWTASTGATSYNVYRGTTAGGESGTAIATGIATTSYTNTGLTNGTTYYFTVKAVNAAGTSGASNEASGAPTAGVNLVPDPGFESGQGGWYFSYSGTGVDPVLSTAAAHNGTNGVSMGGSYANITQTVTGLTPNTAYTLTVWGRLITAATGNNVALNVTAYGGSEIDTWITTTTYSQYTISFTTGASSTSAKIGVGFYTGSTCGAYCDDFNLH